MITEFNNTFFEKHIMFTSANEVQLVCQPFFDRTKTTYFNYVRRYHDGSKMCLSNRADWMKYFYEQKLFEDILIEKETINYKNPPIGNITIILWAGLHDSKVVREQSCCFGIGNGISLAIVYGDYIDYYYFGTGNKNVEMSNWYINNVGTLIEFIHYFKENAKDIICQAIAPQNLIAMGKNANLFPKNSQFSASNDRADCVKPKHYFIHMRNKEVLITAREMECIKYVARGYPSSQIGKLLDVSERTIEKHIENVKERLECHSKADLIDVIFESGLNSLISIQK